MAMLPAAVEQHLQSHHAGFKHSLHPDAVTASDLAAVEHVTGRRVAKPVIVKLDGRLAIAVVSAAHRVSLSALEEATGADVELAPEQEFAQLFQPCEPGAEPPLSIFGLQIFVDEALTHQQTLLMPGGTHRDAIELDTHDWLSCESVQPIALLGLTQH
jgi:Ala-tRNA(Pro) deacylase